MISDNFKDTNEYSVYSQIKELYELISEKQKEWYAKSKFTCPSNCGECCRNFEPDLLESEALFMAIWLLENRREVADQVEQGNFPFPQNNGCPFWDEHNSYHCTIYEGRAFICRFFGASAFHSKTGETVFKPCKLYPSNELEKFSPPVFHKQYSESEILNQFGAIPIVMSDIMQRAIQINPANTKTKLLREILPQMISKVKWIMSMSDEPDPFNTTDTPEKNAS